MESKLNLLVENKGVISETDRNKIRKTYDTSVKEYKKRKRICMDMLNGILESYPKSKSALMEEIGIELDNENNTPVIS